MERLCPGRSTHDAMGKNLLFSDPRGKTFVDKRVFGLGILILLSKTQVLELSSLEAAEPRVLCSSGNK